MPEGQKSEGEQQSEDTTVTGGSTTSDNGSGSESGDITAEEPVAAVSDVQQDENESDEPTVQAETEEVKWFIESSRFGMVPKTGYANVTNEGVESTFKTAMGSFKETAITAVNISVDLAEQLIVKILELIKMHTKTFRPMYHLRKIAAVM